MANTVSRRLVFMKVKRKPIASKPRPPAHDGEKMVGEVSRPMQPLLAAPVRTVKRKIPWSLIAVASGALLALTVLSTFLVRLSDRMAATPVTQYTAPASPGYIRSASGGGQPGNVGSGRTSARPMSTAEGFLASPFPKRKPTSCAIQIDGGKDSLREFSACLELAGENGASSADESGQGGSRR